MKKAVLLIFICGLLPAKGAAQTEEKKNDIWEKNFFMGLSSSTILDFGRSQLKTISVVVGNDIDPNDPNKLIPRYSDVPYQTFCQNFFSMGLEPRFNIYQLSKDAAFAISMPMAFGLGMAVPASEEMLGNEGFGSLQIPLMAKFYLGNSSTYETEKDFGISVGGGIEYNKLGLIKTNLADNTFKDAGYVLGVGSIAVHFWRGNSPFEVNLKYGNGKITTYDTDKYGNPLKDSFGNITSKITRSNSFKVSFVYLVNY